MSKFSDSYVLTGKSINRLIEKSKNSRRAFTLVEMLIVVAILAILMSIVFRISNVGSEDAKRTQTVVRLQRVENCLSGYYAAFGSYPPVKVHGTRDIRAEVDVNGDQNPKKSDGNNQSEGGESLVWAQVNAACRSQPFGCEYPPQGRESGHADGSGDTEEDAIINWSREYAERVGNSQDYPKYADSAYAKIFENRDRLEGPDAGDFSGEKYWGSADWKLVKLFKFGMMSYLLPRYLFMMGGNGEFFGVGSTACAQWTDNNDLPSDPFEGDSFSGWDEVRENSQSDSRYADPGQKKNYSDLARIANIPTQAVCARWMPNLEGICMTLTKKTFFGVSITGEGMLTLDDENPPDPKVHNTPSGKPYKNAMITVHDGWNNEFYYYSPAPYQSYSVWSAGANGKTFPPWMSLDSLNSDNERQTALKWKSDDIIQMSH